MPVVRTALLALLCLGSALPVLGEPRLGAVATPGFPVAAESGQEDTFDEIPEAGTPVQPLLINGVQVDRRHFPTMFRKVSGNPCTAVLIGPATMLTAAHCMAGNTHVRFRLRDTRVRGFCERASAYPGDQSQDWALCLLEFPIVDIRYETVAVSTPSSGTSVTLTGYGCTSWNGPSDGTILRVGVATLLLNPPGGLAPESSTIYTRTDVAGGGVVVCPGDSGGPLFVIPGGSLNGARSIVAVNSRSAVPQGISLFSALGSAAGSDFIKKWAIRRDQKICGINSEDNCR